MSRQAVIYARISEDREGKGLGVARQEADCRALCARQGWEVADVLVDNDRSAYSGKRRPAYETLLEGLKAGRWSAVVAWHPDRLHRAPKELEGFIDVVEAGSIEVSTVMAGVVDLSTATGRMTARVVGAVARHESELKSERTKRKHRELAEAGHPLKGGWRPFGYEEDRLTPHLIEAPLVVAAARAILDGVTLRGIVRDWATRDILTPAGKPWSTFALRRLLTSARVAGYRIHGGHHHRAKWPGLIDEVTWRRVRAVLLDPARRVNQSPRTYLLTGGLAVCGLCGAKLVARPRADGRRSYVCASGPGFGGCGKIRVLADDLEADVASAVAGQLRNAPLPHVEVEGGDVLLRIDEAEAALAELAADYYGDRAITRAQFQAASARLQDRIAGLRSEAGALERRTAAPPDALAVLEADGVDARKRAVVAAVVAAVIVGPAVRGRNFYDPGRVRIDWLA